VRAGIIGLNDELGASVLAASLWNITEAKPAAEETLAASKAAAAMHAGHISPPCCDEIALLHP
jgi:hypothetical protein